MKETAALVMGEERRRANIYENRIAGTVHPGWRGKRVFVTATSGAASVWMVKWTGAQVIGTLVWAAKERDKVDLANRLQRSEAARRYMVNSQGWQNSFISYFSGTSRR